MITTNYLWMSELKPDGTTINRIFKITVQTPSYGSQFENFVSCHIGAMRYGKRNGCSNIEFKSEKPADTPATKLRNELANAATQLGITLTWT